MNRSEEKRSTELKYIEKFCIFLDKKYTLKGTNFKFGADPIIGLIPVAGHVITFIISGALILVMARHGVSGKVAVKMVLNITIDTLVGAIPVLGNIFDFFYKANIKNVKLLKEHYDEDKHKGSGIGLIIISLLILLLVLVGIIGLFIWIITEIF